MCYIESEISFKFYTNPFQVEVWILIAASIITFTVYTDAFIKVHLKLETTTSIFFYIGAFLEETSWLPSKLPKHSAFPVGVGCGCMYVL